MANTGLRPDEANRLEYGDVTVECDKHNGDKILLIDVRGKRGVRLLSIARPARSSRSSVWFKRIDTSPPTLVVPQDHKRQFGRALASCDLKLDRQRNRRSAYSLRHAYSCLRPLEGADVYQIAKNCRTSVEMIEKHYALHLNKTLDAKAINARRATKSPIGHRSSVSDQTSRLENLAGSLKLSEIQPRDVRARLATGEPRRDLAKAFYVSKRTISRV